MEENNVETICQVIYTLIPEVLCLKELFQSWCVLDSAEQAQLDVNVNNHFRRDRALLYIPLKEALNRWNKTQDTQGAPGCEQGLVSFANQPSLEAELVNVIYGVHTLIEKMKVKNKPRTPTKRPASLEVPRSTAAVRDESPHRVARSALTQSTLTDN